MSHSWIDEVHPWQQTSWRGPHPGCDTEHPHTHPISQPGPTPDDYDWPLARPRSHSWNMSRLDCLVFALLGPKLTSRWMKRRH